MMDQVDTVLARTFSFAWLLCALSGCSVLFQEAGSAADSDGAPGTSDARPPMSCQDTGPDPLPIRCLEDDFEAARPAIWNPERNRDSNGVDLLEGRLRLGMSELGDDRSLIISVDEYTLIESEIVAQVVRVPDPGYLNVWSVMTLFAPSLDSSLAVEIGCNNGYLKASLSRGDDLGWQELPNPVPCDMTDASFWKISHTGNTVSFWYSKAGFEWNLLGSTDDTDLTLDRVVVGFLLENYSPQGFDSVDNSFLLEAVNR